MHKIWALLLTAISISFVIACSDEESSSIGSPEEDLSKPCEEEGAYEWIEEGKSFKLCQDSIWQLKEVKENKPGFDPCQFNFGASWQESHETTAFYGGLDYISAWLGDNSFLHYFEKRMLDMCQKVNATPMLYAYVIAEVGKDMGMDDCDVAKARGKKSLCEHGANLIRENFRDSILYRYQAYASQMRLHLEGFGLDLDKYETIWLIEPDFYQYSESASNQSKEFSGIEQIGGGIPDEQMAEYFKEIVDTIRTYLPAAKIAIDISPWIGDRDTLDLEKWYSHFDMDIVDYASTSGGRTLANSAKIKSSNRATWKKIHEITGKPILADAGYDAGGRGTRHDKTWDDIQNITNRAADGVIGVMQMDADSSYSLRSSYIRTMLDIDYPWCSNK